MRISDWSSDVCSSDLLLLVDPRNLDRGLIGGLDLDPLGHREIDVVAVTELELEVLALRGSTIADAGDLEHLGEAFGDAGDEVLHQRALHAPEGDRKSTRLNSSH